MPILNRALKCAAADPSPAGFERPGENVWSPKLPLTTAFDSRSACVPKPYREAAGKVATLATATS